jgi:hypothetical protein
MPFDSTSFSPTEDAALDVLRTARAYLKHKRKRWCQGTLRHDKARCALGAIDDALLDQRPIPDLNVRVHAALGRTIRHYASRHYASAESPRHDGNYRLIMDYNDRSTTRYKDILAVFKQTIRRLEQTRAESIQDHALF